MRSILLAGVALVAMASTARANLLVNGDFSQGTYTVTSVPSDASPYWGTAPVPVGWTPTVGWISPYTVGATLPIGSISFANNGNDPIAGLSQAFTDVCGMLYQVSLAILLPQPGGASVTIDGKTELALVTSFGPGYSVTTTTFADGNSVTDPASYAEYTFQFIGNGRDSIGISAISGYRAATFGPIDVHPAPAPLLATGIPAFLMLGASGFLGRFRNRFKREIVA